MDKKLRLSLIFQAGGNAVSFLKGVKGGAAGTEQALKAAHKRVKELQASTRDVSAFRKMEASLQGTRDALVQQRTEAARVAAAHSAAAAPTKALTRALDLAKTKLGELEVKEDGQLRALAELEGRLRAAGGAVDALGDHERRLAMDLGRANGELAEQSRRMDQVTDRQRRMAAARTRYDGQQQLAATMQGAGATSLAGGVAMAAPAVVSIGNANQLESQTTTIAQRSNMDPAAAKAFEATMLNAARMANQTREETTATFDELTAQGFDPGPAIAIAAAVGRAATAYKEEGVAIAAAAGSLRNIKIEASQTGQALDIMAVAGKRGNFEFGAMARAFPSLTAGAAAYGMTGLAAVADLAAAAQIARRGAGSDDEAATNLENLLQKIGSPETARKFASVGINLRTELQKGEAAGVSALETIIELTRKATGGDASRLGSFFEDAQVQKAVRPLMAATDEYRKIRADALAANGEVDRDFTRRLEDGAEATKRLRVAADLASVTFGAKLAPSWEKAANAGTRVIERVDAWAKANPALAQTVATVFTVIAGGLIVFGGLAIAVAAVLGPFALMQLTLSQTGLLLGRFAGQSAAAAASQVPLQAGVTATAVGLRARLVGGLIMARNAMLGFNVALLANPITWIVLAVVALAAAAFLIWKNWAPISAFFGRLWSGIKGAVAVGARAVLQTVMKWTPLGAIVRNWSGITGFIGSVWTLAKETVGLGIDLIKLYLMNFTPLGMIVRKWAPISGAIAGVWNGIKSAVSAGIAAVLGYVMNFTPLGFVIRNWGAITGAIGGVWETVKSTVSAGIGVVSGLIERWGPLNAFKSAFASTFSWLENLPKAFLGYGRNLVDGLIQGVRGGRAAVQAETASVATASQRGFRRPMRIDSPSKVFAQYGGFLMEGLADGIAAGRAGPIGRMRAASAAVAAAAAVAMPAIASPAVEAADVGRSPIQAEAAAAGREVPPSSPGTTRATPPQRLDPAVVRPVMAALPAADVRADWPGLLRGLTARLTPFTPAPSPGTGLEAVLRRLAPLLDIGTARDVAPASSEVTITVVPADPPVPPLPPPGPRAPPPASPPMAIVRAPPASSVPATGPSVAQLASLVSRAAGPGPAAVLRRLSPFIEAGMRAFGDEAGRGLPDRPITVASRPPADRDGDDRGLRASLASGADLFGARPAPVFETSRGVVDRPVAPAEARAPAAPSIGSVTIQIYQQPGEDPEDLARRVAELIQQPRLGRLGDQDGDSYGEQG